MTKLLLAIYLLTGKVEKNDGLYTVRTNKHIYEYACKGEVMAWIETGEFKFNDQLCEAGELQ